MGAFAKNSVGHPLPPRGLPTVFLIGSIFKKKEITMNEAIVQAVIWVAAATTLLLYLKRRRKRKMLP
jgi:hypothetical protein